MIGLIGREQRRKDTKLQLFSEHVPVTEKSDTLATSCMATDPIRFQFARRRETVFPQHTD